MWHYVREYECLVVAGEGEKAAGGRSGKAPQDSGGDGEGEASEGGGREEEEAGGGGEEAVRG